MFCSFQIRWMDFAWNVYQVGLTVNKHDVSRRCVSVSCSSRRQYFLCHISYFLKNCWRVCYGNDLQYYFCRINDWTCFNPSLLLRSDVTGVDGVCVWVCVGTSTNLQQAGRNIYLLLYSTSQSTRIHSFKFRLTLADSLCVCVCGRVCACVQRPIHPQCKSYPVCGIFFLNCVW